MAEPLSRTSSSTPSAPTPTASSPSSTRRRTSTSPAKGDYDLVPIYERHAELTKLETAQALGATVNGGRNVRELWRFACEGYLGNS